MMSTESASSTTCVATWEASKYCESFVNAHIEGLPGRVVVLQGFPLGRDGEGRSLLNEHPAMQLFRRGYGYLGGDSGAFRRRAIAKYLRRTGVRAVLAEKGPVAVQMIEVCDQLNIPLVAHFHGIDAYGEDVIARCQESYERLFRKAAALVAVSEDMVHQLERLGAPAEKIVCIPSGIDLDKFGGGRPADVGPDFLAVGRFVEKKAPQLTIVAFARVLASCPQAKLRMVAEGPLLEPCRELATGLRLGDAVEFLGPRSHDEVAALMRQSRAFVQHSLRPANGDSEGTPVGILEASATSLPVVSTRHAGIKQAVSDGETGFLVDERDVDGMAAAMLRLAEDPELAARMGRAGRERISQHYCADRQIEKLWHVIESSLAKAPKSKGTAAGAPASTVERGLRGDPS